MTTTSDPDQHPGTPVVHLSRRAALAAERLAAGETARRTHGSGAAEQRPSEDRVRRIPRRPAPVATRMAAVSGASRPAASATHAPRGRRTPGRSARAGRNAVTSGIAALALFAASAMPAHASGTTSIATAALTPSVTGQDYAVDRAVTVAQLARDGFTVGGGADGAPGTSVSYGGDVRSPFPGPVRMSSGFGYRSAPCGACSSLHEGLDFTPGLGTPIGAVAKGTVRISGTYFSYGTAVVIDHVVEGRRVSTLYGHMVPGSSPLRPGDDVEAGEFIGRVGNSGVSTGAHLHLEVLMDGVTPIDPEVWLEARIGHSLTL
ncbi:M23 family metallopeptidase [Curtobacterium sp. ISL-83]|uniref:M23 family metallopeptidase n=1 Tax=Curtobacterium sp. ISL-83 TaxID=2819145 RepID=UPI001BEB0260|nr:M23 family metallopeptidase [Curtobacterium sp. ISL-83]MBT2502086.1 M23 family metallopeptidase [Curtobacterium sp. ISL-83]